MIICKGFKFRLYPNQEQEDLLRGLQSMPDIVMAELVCHYFGDESDFDAPS